MATNISETVDCTKSLTTGLRRLFNDETTSDITLAVGEKRYAVHKNILAASSVYFQRLFYGGQWKESAQKEIPLKETSDCEAVFDTFVKYFYTGIIDLCPETAPYILTLADKYDATVKQDCIAFMIKIINEGNLEKALQWIPLCNLIKAVTILHSCYAIICFNLEKASKTPEWSSLPLHDLSIILQRRDIIIPSEYNIYEAVQDWAKSQTNCTTENIGTLLSHFEFNNMTAVELGQVEESYLATDLAPDIVNQHVSKAFRYLAFKAEHKESDKVNISRIYTKGEALMKVQFKPNGSAYVNPRYNNQTEVTERYKWILSTRGETFSIAVERVTVAEEVQVQSGMMGYYPTMQRQMKRFQLSYDIAGNSRVDIMICLLNSEENTVKCITKTFADITMPTQDGGEVVSFSVKGVHSKPDGCFISIDMF